MMAEPSVCGLVLTGGGTRGAYQVGVFKALAEIVPQGPVPFPVITGVSVGALNAVGLASNFESFQNSASKLAQFWTSLHTPVAALQGALAYMFQYSSYESGRGV